MNYADEAVRALQDLAKEIEVVTGRDCRGRAVDCSRFGGFDHASPEVKALIDQAIADIEGGNYKVARNRTATALKAFRGQQVSFVRKEVLWSFHHLLDPRNQNFDDSLLAPIKAAVFDFETYVSGHVDLEKAATDYSKIMEAIFAARDEQQKRDCRRVAEKRQIKEAERNRLAQAAQQERQRQQAHSLRELFGVHARVA